MKKISHGTGQLSERFEGLKYAWGTSDWEKYAWGTSDWEKSSRTKILSLYKVRLIASQVSV